jgi:uncharacterized Zn ribbon protein
MGAVLTLCPHCRAAYTVAENRCHYCWLEWVLTEGGETTTEESARAEVSVAERGEGWQGVAVWNGADGFGGE